MGGEANMIEHYEFGEIRVDGDTYTNDILILPNKKILAWWRRSGHKVINDDLAEVYKHKPEVLIIGTGRYGIVQVTDEVYEYCFTHNIRLIVKDTIAAIKIYNKDASKSKAAGFHLTC